MKELAGRVAVITGGASGIGKALGARLARERMKIVLADVEVFALENAVADLQAAGAEDVAGVVADVASQDSVNALAKA